MINLINNANKNEMYKIIKPHTKQKFIFIGGIFYLISRIVKRGFIFIDLYCGEGLCKCDIGQGMIEDEDILGSPLLLLDKFNDERYHQNLDKIYCNDIDTLKIKTLEYWINNKFPKLKDKVEYLNLDAKEAWKKIKLELSPKQGIIILIDPDNINSMISFNTLKEISNFSNKEFYRKYPFIRRPELIINFMHYGVTRSWLSISPIKLSEITNISIDKIEEIRKIKSGKKFTDEILKIYSKNIKELGYKMVLSYDVINIENNSIIYKIILASNHPSATELYEKKNCQMGKKYKRAKYNNRKGS